MSLETTGKQCSACKAYLFEDDDVVYCPVCGAPHHRECYNAVGHCALEELHGTDRQYDSSKYKEPEEVSKPQQPDKSEIKCQMCENVYDESSDRCPKCGTVNPKKYAGISFDLLGGVPGDMDLGDGVTANEAKRFVISNTQRYIPKFAANKMGKKASFNLAAFLFPCGWFFSRKMYKWGSLVGALSVAFALLCFPLQSAIYYLDMSSAQNYAEMAQIISDNIARIGMPAMLCAVAGSFLYVLLRIICGIFGDLFYRNHVIASVSSIKKTSDDEDTDFVRRGGVNFIMLLVGIIAVQYLPTVLFSLFAL